VHVDVKVDGGVIGIVVMAVITLLAVTALILILLRKKRKHIELETHRPL
jgi:Tfp pilus assembly protein PilX